MPKKTILNIRQQAVMGKLALAHREHRRAVEHLRNVYKEAKKLRLPISQVGKRLGINKTSVFRRYERVN